MRELKFRAWDGENMRELYLDELDLYVTVDLPIFQYTGLKDKNNKEIYEGDIFYGVAGHVGVGVVTFGLYTDTDCIDHQGYYLQFTKSMVVLGEHAEDLIIQGNIYENNDLLKSS